MEKYLNPERELWKDICKRPSARKAEIIERVSQIIEEVRRDGDNALRRLSREIERIELTDIRVSDEAITGACERVSPKVKNAISAAARNIETFHRAQLPVSLEVETSPGVLCIQKPVAIPRIGLYIPGGSAPLFSTVLMLAIPARIAGCGEVVLCTPRGKDGKVADEVLYAASFCGIRKIFQVGGAQAIAAMALGTESIPKVDKIFGPGNSWVTTAKQLLSTGTVAIDMPAGPSEVMVLADESADPSYVAADLLSQAEHGADSQVMLVCDSESLADNVREQVALQLQVLERKGLAAAALGKSRIVVLGGREDMTDFADSYAPEHLIIAIREPWEIAGRISCAGSVFIGNYSPESAGDYASGTNHTLPTCGWARAYSGVNVESFMRKMTIQELSKTGLETLSDTIISMAEAEGLQAHANAVKIRIK